MNLIRHLNPLSAITTEAEARDAGRASAVAIFLGVAYGVFTTWQLATVKKAQVMAAMETAYEAAPEMAGMGDVMFSGMIGIGIVFIVIQLILGLVQWFKPNIVIPIIFIILVAYGLLSPLLAFMAPPEQQAQTAGWEWGLLYVVLVVELLLHITGVRGAATLDRLKKLGQAD